MNTPYWINHYEANTRLNDMMKLPDEPCMLPEAIRAPIARSLAVFQLGESGGGTRLKRYAKVIAPLTQFIFVPLMTSGAGADLIGDWYGRGAERGIAIVFTITGVLGVIATIAAFRSQSYRQISGAYSAGDEAAAATNSPQ